MSFAPSPDALETTFIDAISRGWRLVLLGAFGLIVGSPAGAEQVQKVPPNVSANMTAQQTLDFFSTMPFPSTPAAPGALYLPKGPFTSWSGEEQAKVPDLVRRGCQFVWFMAHDAPGTRFLPPVSSEHDEEEIGTEVCVAGHMPGDWPGNQANLDAAEAVLQRAKTNGANLQMPKALAVSTPAGPATTSRPPIVSASPSAEELENATPEKARERHQQGSASIQCSVDMSGHLQDCTVSEEAPAGFGFGAAALALSKRFKITSLDAAGKPVPDGKFKTRITWNVR